MGETLEHLSYSSLRDYKDCGEKFRLKKIERVVSTPSFAMAGGRAVHEVTENLDLRDFGEGDGTTDFAEAFNEEITSLAADTGIPVDEWRITGKPSKGFPNKEDYQWWMIHGPLFVERWRTFLANSPFFIPRFSNGMLGIELELKGTLGGVPYLGYIDRIVESPTGELLIVDLKTGVRKPKPDQLLQYRLMLEQIPGFPLPTRGFYFMNRSGMMTDFVDLNQPGPIEYEYRTAWEGIRNNVFLANTETGWCTSCDVAKFCYAMGGAEADKTRPYGRSSDGAG